MKTLAEAIGSSVNNSLITDLTRGIYELLVAASVNVGDAVSLNTTLKSVGDGVKLDVDVKNEVTVKVADGQTVDVKVKEGEVTVMPKEDATFDVMVKNEDIIVTPSEEAQFNVQVVGGHLEVSGGVDANITNDDPISVSVDNIDAIDVNVSNIEAIDVNVANVDDIDVNVNNAESIDVNITNDSLTVDGSVAAAVTGVVSATILGTPNVLVVNSTDAPVHVDGTLPSSVTVSNWPEQQHVWVAGCQPYMSPMPVAVKTAPDMKIDPSSGPLQVEDNTTHGYLSAYNQAALRTVHYPDGSQAIMQSTVIVAKNVDEGGAYSEVHAGRHENKNVLLTARLI